MQNDFYYCNGCGAKYFHRRSVVRHVNMECGKDFRFQCNICNLIFQNRRDVNAHYKENHYPVTKL